jgi:hypothetical protein
MLEALTETVPLWGRGKFHHLHRPAKRLQRALGDMRDLKRLADLAREQRPSGQGKRSGKRPPGYRRRKKKLLDAAMAAHHELKQAEGR